MERDPLAQYRKTPPAPKGSDLQTGDEEGYTAFGTKDKTKRLKIICPTIVHAPAYNLLLNVISDGKFGTSFILVFSVVMIRVRGKNLQKVVFAVEQGLADWIREFDSQEFSKPVDPNAAFIESIEIKDTDNSSPFGNAKH